MNRFASVSALLMLVFSTACAAADRTPRRYRNLDRDPVQSVTLSVGERDLRDENAWEPSQDQFALGVTYDASWTRGTNVGIGVETSIFGSGRSKEVDVGGDDREFRAGTLEFAVGPRLDVAFGASGIHAYIAGGLAHISAFAGLGDDNGDFFDDDDDDDNDSSFAGYAHIGAYWRIERHFNVGIDFRILRGSDIEVFDVNTDADYDQLTLGFGYSF